MNLEQLPPSYPVVILCLDDIMHTVEWPQCKDETCPCQEHPPYEDCDCGACAYVRQMVEQAPTEQ